MTKRSKLAIGAVGLLAVAGAGGALAAAKLSPQEESKAVVEDAAKQLGVTPERLTDALQQALENRVDAAVEAGRLSEEQGEAMKQRLQDGEVPLFGGPGFGHRGPGHHGFPGHGIALEAAADYLGVEQAELRESLRNGQTLAEVARAEGKQVDGLVGVLVAAATERLDQAVEDGRLTKAKRDELVAGLEQRLTAAVNAEGPRGFRGGKGFGSGGHGGFRGGPPLGDA